MTTQTTQARPRPKLEAFRPVTLTPSTWPQLLRDDHPLGAGLGGWQGLTMKFSAPKIGLKQPQSRSP